MIKGNTLLKILFSIVITTVLIYIILSFLDFSKSKDIVKKFNIYPIFFICFLTIFSYFLRAKRFQVSIIDTADVPFKGYIGIFSIYNLLTAILPLASGEVSYPFLLKKYYNIPVHKSISSLVVSRVAQILFLMLFFLIALSNLESIKQYFPSYINSFIYFLAFINILGFLFASEFLILIKKLLPKKFHIAKQKIIELAKSFYLLKKKKVYIKVVILSLLVTITNIITLYCYFYIFDIQIDLIQATFCLSFNQLTWIFPIHGIAKFGTFESIAIVSFLIIGVPKNSAIILALSIHLISLFLYTFLASIGYIVIRKGRHC